jgi:cell division control protein 7
VPLPAIDPASGTFSTVYKAEDLNYDKFKNDWDIDEKERSKWQSPSRKAQRTRSKRGRFVAIKKIYVTSSPIRILNELELLHDLKDSDAVCPLITAFRHQDQVVAILPYFQHRDFREYFRDFTISEMRQYFYSLFTALKAVHKAEIIHRDIKPTNFLYNPAQARGVLVDFGLAERQGLDWQECPCSWNHEDRIYKYENSLAVEMAYDRGSSGPALYPRTDARPSRRANRAGTRGFRAPEVLLKCTMQTCSIDIWSAGVILLTLLARRFPFFQSADDIDAVLEITNILGKKKIEETAFLHGQILETNIPSYSDKGHSFEKIILWSTNRSQKDKNGHRTQGLRPDEKEAVALLERCMECDPSKRITAEEALRHPFIANAGIGEGDEDMDLL